MTFVLLSRDVTPESAVGGKARALAEMTLAELPVPEWFVVIPEAFRACQLKTDTAALSASAELASEIERALNELDGAADAVFAVRSSAVDEDSAHASYAGQLESFLFVPRTDVLSRVLSVWASAFSERVKSYRRSLGAQGTGDAPAVIVQRMVNGSVSGVAFSADPVSGRRGVAVVAAVPGLASALVSGEAQADTWHVGRDGAIATRTIEVKQLRHRRSAAGQGIESVRVDAREAQEPAIDENMARRVAELARRVEGHFGRPQDIEWTCAERVLYLLQARPITTLANLADPDGVRALWDNSNIVESYGGITTPLTFTFARRAYEHVYREFCRLLRVPDAVIQANQAMFSCMLGLFRGRVYYNLYNWYRLVAVLPGYRLNRRFMEQMMGVRESLPEDVSLEQADRISGLRDAWRLCVSLSTFVVHLATLSHRIGRFETRLRDALGATRAHLGNMRPDELVAYYRRLEERLLVRWDAPIVNDFATMIFHGLLRRLSAAWLGPGNEALHNDLLCAEPGMISEEPARRVARMAALAAADAALVAALRNETLQNVRRMVAKAPALAKAIAEYIDRFGDRCMEELKLESATLHDDPTPLYRAIGEYAAALGSRSSAAETHPDEALRHAAEGRVAQALAGHPLRRLVFASVLCRARRALRARENLRFERTLVFGRARQILLELGKRLAAFDCLERPRDVFYLELEELLAFVEARATTTDLKGLVAVRKKEFDGYRRTPAPDERFETRGLAYRGHSFAAEVPPLPPRGATLRGLACCPGVVRGRVRVVRDPARASIKPGDIVVAERTDPGWVMIFPGAAGLLVERGSLLSHSAIVARELGLPAIVSLPGLTSWLKDGDEVEMDGRTGVVVRLEVADGAAEAMAH